MAANLVAFTRLHDFARIKVVFKIREKRVPLDLIIHVSEEELGAGW